MSNLCHRKLKAATILEVVTAMVIIMIIFAVSMAMFVQVTASGITLEKVNAGLLLNKKAFETKQKQDFTNNEIKEGELLIKQKIEPYGSNPSLILLKIQAETSSGKVLAERKELVAIEK